jgi:hypothetical protein
MPSQIPPGDPEDWPSLGGMSSTGPGRYAAGKRPPEPKAAPMPPVSWSDQPSKLLNIKLYSFMIWYGIYEKINKNDVARDSVHYSYKCECLNTNTSTFNLYFHEIHKNGILLIFSAQRLPKKLPATLGLAARQAAAVEAMNEAAKPSLREAVERAQSDSPTPRAPLQVQWNPA